MLLLSYETYNTRNKNKKIKYISFYIRQGPYLILYYGQPYGAHINHNTFYTHQHTHHNNRNPIFNNPLLEMNSNKKINENKC